MVLRRKTAAHRGQPCELARVSRPDCRMRVAVILNPRTVSPSEHRRPQEPGFAHVH